MSKPGPVERGLQMLMVVVVAGVWFASCHGATVDGADARRVLEDAGYEDAGDPSHTWFGCDREFYRGRVAAVNPRGRRVEVTVCCGLWMKDCTVRH